MQQVSVYQLITGPELIFEGTNRPVLNTWISLPLSPDGVTRFGDTTNAYFEPTLKDSKISSIVIHNPKSEPKG